MKNAKNISNTESERVSGGVSEIQDAEYIQEMQKALEDRGVLCERCGRAFVPITKDVNDTPPKLCPQCSCGEEK